MKHSAFSDTHSAWTQAEVAGHVLRRAAFDDNSPKRPPCFFFKATLNERKRLPKKTSIYFGTIPSLVRCIRIGQPRPPGFRLGATRCLRLAQSRPEVVVHLVFGNRPQPTTKGIAGPVSVELVEVSRH